jgi:Ca2+:H+ antiporter
VTTARIPAWTWALPLLGWVLIGLWFGGVSHTVLALARIAVLIGSVLAAVHHAETVAHRVGEPFGTLLLALAVTAMELALIISLSLKGEATLARDTVFATIMIILNGMVGICLLLGASRHREQYFSLYGVNATLAALATISIITLVVPNTTTSQPGPYYTSAQLAFVGIVCLIIYAVFVLVQTVRHRDYFLPEGEAEAAQDTGHTGGAGHLAITSVLGLVGLGAVILLAKSLGPAIERGVARMGAPEAVVGVVIAAIVLLPEGLAAIRAAHADRLQTSLNLALGSAMASIGLTIPAVAAISIMTHWPLVLGIDPRGTVLLALSLLTAALSLGTGRTTVLQGAVHLVIFGVYLFTTVVP